MAPFVLVGAFLVLAASGSAPTRSTAAQFPPATRTEMTGQLPGGSPGTREQSTLPFQGRFAPAGGGPGLTSPLARSMRNLAFQTPGSMSSHGPEIVCGTAVFRGDPDIDPGIVRRSPDTGTRFTMRRFPWPGCGQ